MKDPADPSRIGPSRIAIDRGGIFTEELGAVAAAATRPGDVFVIETPGGGGDGEPACSS